MNDTPNSGFREKIHEIIFEADTPAGKLFDVVLLVLILISVLTVILESVQEFDQKYHSIFFYTEWTLTFLFTIEYLVRIYCVYSARSYVLSFFGVVDLLSILPTYLTLVLPGSHYLLTIRALRLLRVFRIFKLARFLSESRVLIQALKASRPKIIVFLGTILTIVIIIGSAMYMVEGKVDSGFTSIPRSMYWAIVTITTVGYGDITPDTILGQFFSSILMILGYAIIAVPTGIFSAELIKAKDREKVSTQVCMYCGEDDHDHTAVFCKKCGGRLKD